MNVISEFPRQRWEEEGVKLDIVFAVIWKYRVLKSDIVLFQFRALEAYMRVEG